MAQQQYKGEFISLVAPLLPPWQYCSASTHGWRLLGCAAGAAASDAASVARAGCRGAWPLSRLSSREREGLCPSLRLVHPAVTGRGQIPAAGDAHDACRVASLAAGACNLPQHISVFQCDTSVTLVPAQSAALAVPAALPAGKGLGWWRIPPAATGFCVYV